MIHTPTPTKLLLVADQRRADSGAVRRYRIARLRTGATPSPGVALPQRKSS
jgi:hypothetical protein